MADLISRSGVGGPPAPGALRPRRPSGSVPPRRPSGSVPLGECAHGCRISLGPWHRPVKDIHTEGTPTRLQPAFMIMAIWPMGVAEQIRIQPHRPGFHDHGHFSAYRGCRMTRDLGLSRLRLRLACWRGEMVSDLGKYGYAV